MSHQAVVCPNCGAKVKATRSRCPRCRAELHLSALPSSALQNPWIPKIAGGILALAVVIVGIVWFRQSGPEAPVSVSVPSDPLSARRQKGPVAAAETVKPVGGGLPSDPSFIEPEQVLALPNGASADSSALDLYRAAAERNPQDADAFANLGRTLLGMGRGSEALAPLKQAADLAADRWPIAMAYALANARLGRWPEAVGAFRRAKSLMPNDASTSYDLALALQRQAAYLDASVEYGAALQLNPNAAPARLGLAISLDRLGRATDAIGAYKEALRLFSEGPDADTVRARIAQLER